MGKAFAVTPSKRPTLASRGCGSRDSHIFLRNIYGLGPPGSFIATRISEGVGNTMARKQILVIEDDADIRECLMLLLESEGYSVAGAADGREGLDVLARMSGPCLILLDLMMPVMNGWEFLQAKRKEDILAVIPVVVLSAGSDARGEQVEGILKKPVDVDALLAFVRKHCGSSCL